MKFLYASLFAGLVLAGYFTYKPQQFVLVRELAKNSYTDVFYRKTVSIRGVQLLSPAAVKKLLPLDYSNAWWSLNASFIDSALEKNPLIQDADTQHCNNSLLDFSCFTVTIQERVPSYVSLYGEEAMILGEDGAPIYAARGVDIERALQTLLDPESRSPTMLIGLVTPGVSSDITHARFQYMSEGIRSIESTGALTVTRMELLANGELSVRLKDIPYEIIFDDSSRQPDRMKDEVARLLKLIPELDARKDQVLKVDLAFNKMAVVSYR